LTVGVVIGFWQLVVFAGLETQTSHLFSASTRSRDSIASEELLVYTHLVIVSGIFLPNVVVRVTQNYYSKATSPERESKARHTTAGSQ
jgi:hypothetical protein